MLKSEGPKCLTHHENGEVRARWDKKPSSCTGTTHSREETRENIREDKAKEEGHTEIRERIVEGKKRILEHLQEPVLKKIIALCTMVPCA